MKWLLLVPVVLVFASCEALFAAAQQPEVLQPLGAAAAAVVTGDWSRAAVGLTAGVGALITAGVGKWVHKRMKDAPPGQVLA